MPTQRYTEEELLTSLKQHDNQAYEFLYDNYSKAIFAVIKQIIPQQEVAEDILQEVFVKVWQNIQTYDVSKGRLYTWMISIARNLSIDRTRSKEFNKQSKTASLQDTVHISGNIEESKISDIGLKKILTSLPADNAKLIDLAYFKGFTQEEISKIMMIPVGTVKTRMRSAISFFTNQNKTKREVTLDISCIISSGDLELYVLGQLSEEDNLKVAQLAHLFPEIYKEIADIEASLMEVGDETDVPSASVRTALFEKLATLSSGTDNTTGVAANGKDTDHIADKKESTIISMVPPKRRNNALLAASVVALIACAGIIAYLVGANNKFRNEADNQQAQIMDLQQKAQTQNQNLVFYQDTSYQKINLIHTPGKPDALAQIFWNRATKNVYVADISLPDAPAGKQYQLWAIVDGKPVNAGMINTKKTPQQMINFAKADAFAITLEKKGGSEKPTLSEMYVMGKTS